MMQRHDYQNRMIDFAYWRLIVENQPGVAWWADPGLGKTLCALELTKRLRKQGQALRTLVIAPLDVCYSTWPTEIQKFGYPWIPRIIHSPTNNTAAFRKRQCRGGSSYIHLINPEGVKWLSESTDTEWDLVIVDESTKFKNWSAVRTEKLVQMVNANRIKKLITMTGTPKPNGYQDIYSQMWLCDHGQALGPTLTYYRQWALQQIGWAEQARWGIRNEQIPEIERRIAPLVMRVDARDHLELPHVKNNVVYVDLPPDVFRVYADMHEQLLALLDSGETLAASNAGVKYSMCRQIANGGCWYRDDDEQKQYEEIHTVKIEAIKHLVDGLDGQPVIIAFQFNHDLDRLLKVWPKAPYIKGKVKANERKAIIANWNEGRIPIMFVQPQALAHGANMQAGGANMIWYGLTDQYELFDQLKRRLWRQGQEADTVRFHYVLARHTVDYSIMDNLKNKGTSQQQLMDAIKRRRNDFHGHGVGFTEANSVL